ncbi:MAG TPA: hypothetical protein VK123_11470 [Candidatus Limnocylindrales bacterium]|nr:hypothetical protein [Candidatus Limnocylindrales bacterium]
MLRRIAPILFLLSLVIGCAGSSKLSQKSEEKLAGGDAWRAWQLATRALDKEPGNPRARTAATAAGASIAQDWQRRIRALAEVDSLNAADEVMKLAEFRVNAARYATIPVGAGWPDEERTLRQTAARTHYQRGREAADSGRPKRACNEFSEAERFVNGFRDTAKRADLAMNQALTRVAVLPFRSSTEDASFGTQVAQAWQDDLVENLAPPATQFTRILGGESLKRSMTLSDLEDLSRGDAVRLGRKSGAERVVWGSVGSVKSSTKLHLFRDTVVRRVTDKDAEGHEVTRWVDVPIEVVARVRDVTVGVDYEVISTSSGTSLVHRHVDRSTQARVVWTSSQIDGDPSSYSLVSETVRASNPDRARDVESRWSSVCGNATTLVQVLEARKQAPTSARNTRETLARFAAGAAFVFLDELPPAEDLALAVLSKGSAPLRDDLLHLDEVDDVDLGVEVPESDTR